MGASASSAASSLPEDASALLTRFAGPSPVSASDPFWSRLLASHAEPLTAHDPAAVDRALRPHCVSLAANDARTGNLAGLLLHASRALRAESRCARRDAADDDPAGAAVPIVAVNATTLAGVVLKHLVEREPAAALRDALNRAAPGDDDDPNAGPGGGGPARGGRRGSSEPSEAAEETPAREFLLAVVETLVAAGGAANTNKNKNKNKTAAAAAPLVVACCRVLVACAYAPPRREAESVSPLFRALALACGGPSHGFRGADGGERLTPAAALVEAALAVVAERPPAGADPSRAVVAATRPAGRHHRDPLGAASDGKSLAAAAFAFFAADSSRADAGPGAGPHGAKHAGGNALPNPSPAADAFASALLALTLGAPAAGEPTTTGASSSSSGGAPLERTPTRKNPFLDALDAAEDASEDASASEESKNKRVVPRVDFDALARSLCAGVHRGDDRAAMLLHRLLTAPKPKPSGEAAGSLASGSSSLARRPTSFFSKFALRADSDARAQRALAAALLRAAYEGAPVRGLGGGHVLALAAFLKLSGSPAFAGALFSRDDEERERESAPEARRLDASAASASTRRSSGSFGEIAPDVSWYRERQASAFSLGSTALATLAKAARCGADPLASDAGPPPNGNGTPSETTTSPSSSRSDGSRFRERGEKTLVAALAVAAVANLAPAFEGVAAHAAQRLASLLDALAKRRGKYVKAEAEERIRRNVLSEEETRRRAEAQGEAEEGGTTDDGGPGAQQSPKQSLDLDDPPPSAVVGDLAKVLLEGCFAATLRDPARTRKNPEIVYALLRGRDALDHLLEAEADRSADDRDASDEAAASAADTNASSDRFGAAVSEVRAAVRRFDERIDASGVDVARYASADAVMAVIVAVASETTGAEAGEGGRGRDEHARGGGGGGGGGGAGGASRGGGWSSPSRAAAAEAESSRRVFDVALPAEPGAWMATRAWRLLTSDDPSRGGAGMAWDEWDE